jgi:hypothetical protein
VVSYLVLSQVTWLRQDGHPLRALSAEERKAMEWVAANTSEDSRFLVLSSALHWQKDYVAEWFPALAGRHSIITVQGHEWLPDGAFRDGVRLHSGARIGSYSLATLERWSGANAVVYSHIYLSRTSVGPVNLNQLWYSLRKSPNYRVIYDGSGAAVFAHVPSKTAIGNSQ